MSLHEILIDELRDLYSAENQLVKALPKQAKAISDPTMKQNVKDHLEITKGQVLRLREVFGHIGKKPTGKHCDGMEGCIKEMTEALEQDYTGALKDACIMGAALRGEHYEIAGYTAAIAMAKALGQKEVVTLLNESLAEETTAATNILEWIEDCAEGRVDAGRGRDGRGARGRGKEGSGGAEVRAGE